MSISFELYIFLIITKKEIKQERIYYFVLIFLVIMVQGWGIEKPLPVIIDFNKLSYTLGTILHMADRYKWD